MKTLPVQCRGRQGLTLLEVLLVVVIGVVLAAMFLPDFNVRRKTVRIICVNNLKEIGIGFRVWEGNHGDKYPMDVPVALGGAQELMAKGDVAGCFQVMSNELSTPRILLCPGDSSHTMAIDWKHLSRTNISYYIGLNVVEKDDLQTTISGDDNLVQNGQPVSSGVLELGTNITKWTKDRHNGDGVLLLSDGSVQSITIGGFNHPGGTFNYTNRVVIP